MWDSNTPHNSRIGHLEGGEHKTRGANTENNELGYVWLWYHDKEMEVEPNSNPKASSWGKDWPMPYKETK